MPRLLWPDRELRLTFCTNVLPTRTVEELVGHLRDVVGGVRARLRPELGDAPFGLGLWMPATVVQRLNSDARARDAFTDEVRGLPAEVFTLNGFPLGDFHAPRVKEQVFVPSWAEQERLVYTRRLGELLAGWIGEGETGSISTLPCGKKSLHGDPSFLPRCAGHLLNLVADWHRLRERTGRTLVLGLEPEPGGTLETIDELIVFYREHLLARAQGVLGKKGLRSVPAEELVRRHLGVCFDACHQAVQFDDGEASLDAIAAAGIPIAKLQISSALHVEAPGSNLERAGVLSGFDEPRYLHQVSRREGSQVIVADDLPVALADPTWRRARAWRIHFHVPIHRERVSGLSTTGAVLRQCLARVLERDLTRHLEVETYTWGVLPGEARQGDSLIEGLTEEMRWALRRIDEARPR